MTHTIKLTEQQAHTLFRKSGVFQEDGRVHTPRPFGFAHELFNRWCRDSFNGSVYGLWDQQDLSLSFTTEVELVQFKLTWL